MEIIVEVRVVNGITLPVKIVIEHIDLQNESQIDSLKTTLDKLKVNFSTDLKKVENPHDATVSIHQTL